MYICEDPLCTHYGKVGLTTMASASIMSPPGHLTTRKRAISDIS